MQNKLISVFISSQDRLSMFTGAWNAVEFIDK